MIKKPVLLIFVGIFCLFYSINATTFAPTTLEKFVNTSTIVVIAKVEKVKSRWDDHHAKIYTYTTVSVLETIKGKEVPDSIILQELGGKVGNEALVVEGAAQFNEGEEVLLFLIYHRDRYWLHSMAMGKFNIVKEKNSKIAVNHSITKDLIKLETTKIESHSEKHPEYDLKQFVSRIKEFVANED